MSIEIKAPSFPESVADGTIATWHKQPGEACKRDDLIVDIETDKVVMEVVAPADGSLSDITVAEGGTVMSNEIIAHFTEGAVATTQANEGQSAATATDQSDSSGPAVRKLLHENNLHATQVTGTGKGGRLLKEDVLNYLKHPTPVAVVTPAAPVAMAKEMPKESTNQMVSPSSGPQIGRAHV